MRRSAFRALLAINLAVLGGLAFLWSDEGRRTWTEPEALPPSLGESVVAAASEPVEVSRYRETVERPLFAANRRPGPRKDAGAEAAADALNDVRLLGTYGAGERGGIIVLSGGKVQRVPVGESIGGWRVTGGGEGRSAELVRADGQRRQLELAVNNVAPAAPAAAKGGAPNAVPAPAAEQARPAEAAPATASQRSAAAPGGGAQRTVSPEVQQQRLERINQRRAARGLPPMAP